MNKDIINSNIDMLINTNGSQRIKGSDINAILKMIVNDYPTIGQVISGVKGEAKVTTIPSLYNPAIYPNGLFEKYDVKTVGTFTNFKDSTNTALTVTQAELDANFVQLWVYNGVSSKYISVKPAGAQSATVFDPADNAKVAVMKAISDYFFQLTLIPGTDIPTTNTATNSYINSTGVVTASANWRTTEFVAVTAGLSYIYYGRTNTGNAARAVAGYNDAGTLIAIILADGVDGTAGVQFTVPANVTKIRLCSYSDVTIRLFSLGGTSFKIKSSLLPPSSNDIKPLGMSWGAIGHSVWASDGSLVGIQSLVKKMFSFTDYAKYAYSGNSLTANNITTDSNSILQLEKTDLWTSKDIFTLDCITNDFKLNRPIGTINDFLNNTGALTFYGALRVLHEKLKSLNPKYQMICSNALKRNNGGYTSWSANTQGHTLTDYSIAMEWVANRLSWRFVNQFRDSGITDDNVNNYTSDGLHPTNDGYKKYAEIWIREFMILYYRTLIAA